VASTRWRSSSGRPTSALAPCMIQAAAVLWFSLQNSNWQQVLTSSLYCTGFSLRVASQDVSDTFVTAALDTSMSRHNPVDVFNVDGELLDPGILHL